MLFALIKLSISFKQQLVGLMKPAPRPRKANLLLRLLLLEILPPARTLFIGRDEKQHAYLIAPNAFKKMTVEERKAELIRLQAA